MGKRYLHNDTANVMFAGGTMIPPGEGREVDEEFLPPGNDAAPAEAAPGEPNLEANLHELLAHPVKEIVPLLAEASDETLAGLARIEGEKADPRKTLLSAIGELQLERAQAKTGAPT